MSSENGGDVVFAHPVSTANRAAKVVGHTTDDENWGVMGAKLGGLHGRFR